MIPSLINMGAIGLGGLVGLMIKKVLTESVKETMTQGLGLVILVLGMSMAIKTNETLLLLSCVVLGGVIGELLGIQQMFERIGDRIKSMMGTKHVSETFTEGFVNGIIIFCLGILGIIGAIEFALNQNPDVFYAKALIDGIIAISLTSSFGVGVMFASGFMLVYQLMLCQFAGALAPILTPIMVNEVSAIGGVIIVGAGLNILKILDVKPGNLIPALLLVIAYGGFQILL